MAHKAPPPADVVTEMTPLAAHYAAACSQQGVPLDSTLHSSLHSHSLTLLVRSDAQLVVLLNLFSTLPSNPLSPPHLPTHLKICVPSLRPATLGTLASYLHAQSHLTHLSINATHLPPGAVPTLLNALSSASASPLESLSLTDLDLPASAAHALAAALPALARSLRVLDVSNNAFNAAGVSVLTRACARHPNIRLEATGNLVVIEALNTVTHGVAAVTALPAGAALVLRSVINSNPPITTVSVAVFAASLVALFAASTAYHSQFRRPALHARLRTLDHAAIFLLIAGSYTPYLCVFAPGPSGWGTLVAIWASAAAGMYRSLRSAGSSTVRAIFALVTGWMGVLSMRTLVGNMPLNASLLTLTGGVVYSVGAAFYLAGKKVPFLHVLWHVAVMIAGGLHFFVVAKYIVHHQPIVP